jgi:opacity protein-like surface antigen
VLLLLGVLCVLQPSVARGEPATGWYLGGGLGFCHLDQEESKDEEADLGFHLGATCGYRFDRWWALELETGVIHNDIPAEEGEEGFGGLTQVPLVLHAVVHFANDSKLEPFLGAGAGLTLASTEEDSGGDGTLAFKGGVRYLLSERVALGLDYTFFMLGATSALAEEAVGSDTFNLSVRWMF